MPVMSAIERIYCRSAPWRGFAGRRVLPWALAGHRLTGDVLEIGAGSGAMADAAARRFPEARLTVTDLDLAMVSAARTRLAGHPGVAVQAADVCDLPFPAGSFDSVTSYLMLHHVVDWQDALTEAARVLRPGGMLLGYDLTDTRAARILHLLDRSPHRLVAPAELREGLAVAGFADISVETAAAEHLMRFHATKPPPG